MHFRSLVALLALASCVVALPHHPVPINSTGLSDIPINPNDTDIVIPATTSTGSCNIFIRWYQKCAPKNSGDPFPTWERYNGFVVPSTRIQDGNGKTTEPWRGVQQESGWRNTGPFKWLIHGLDKDTGLEYTKKRDTLHFSYPGCAWDTDSGAGCGQCYAGTWNAKEPSCTYPVTVREKEIYCWFDCPPIS